MFREFCALTARQPMPTTSASLIITPRKTYSTSFAYTTLFRSRPTNDLICSNIILSPYSFRKRRILAAGGSLLLERIMLFRFNADGGRSDDPLHCCVPSLFPKTLQSTR